MALTDIAIRAVKPTDKPQKLFDGGGMFLFVTPTGARLWRLKYRIGGREKLLALGSYPQVSLKEARKKRDDARQMLSEGVDPSIAKKATATANVQRQANSFEIVAREWFAKNSPTWAENHSSKIIRRLERDIFPWIGDRPTADVTAPELLQALRRIEERGAIETAHRILQNCGQIFRYAIATGRAARDPAADLRGALPPTKPVHHPSLTDPKEIGPLLRALDGYSGTLTTKCALRLAPLVFVRPGELRKAEWKEFDLDKAEWRIPAARMKMRTVHLVPLSTQAIAILLEIKPLTGCGLYVFSGARSSKRPMSENTVNAALRRLGYSTDQMTGHGFRSMASTILNEQQWPADAIERQLAHMERDSVRAAYNYAEFLPQRRQMMQAWADYLDLLKKGVPDQLRKAANRQKT